MSHTIGFGLYRKHRYRFYDTPDGEDFFKKLGATTRWGAGLGLVNATVDIMLVSHPKTYAQAAGRVIYLAGPLVGMAGAFSSVTYLSANMRKKDDIWNHCWGAIASGLVFGRWLKSYNAGVFGSMGLVIFAMCKKHCEMIGMPIFPDMVPIVGGIKSAQRDFSLTAEGEKSWTTDPNDTAMDQRLVVRRTFETPH